MHIMQRVHLLALCKREGGDPPKFAGAWGMADCMLYDSIVQPSTVCSFQASFRRRFSAVVHCAACKHGTTT